MLQFRHPLTLTFDELKIRHNDILEYLKNDDQSADIPEWIKDEELVIVYPDLVYDEVVLSRLLEYQRLVNYALLGYCKSISFYPQLIMKF